MKTSIGVGISVLSALAAQGKDFDRTELPAMCGGCDKAAHCAGGCREAARVFRGSVVAPDPVCETVKP